MTDTLTVFTQDLFEVNSDHYEKKQSIKLWNRLILTRYTFHNHVVLQDE
jgi:hypothetical protein